MASAMMASGALQGAAMGAQIGGPIGAMVGGGIGLLAGFSQESKATKQAKKYNQAVLQSAISSMFSIQQQQNAVNQQTARSLAAYDDNLKVQTATYDASYGAADMLGSSGAEALRQVTSYQTSQAKAATWNNWETSVDNYNKQVNDVYTQSSNALINDIDDASSSRSAGASLMQLIGSIKTPTAKESVSSSSNSTFATKGTYNYGSLSDIYTGAGGMGTTSYSYGSLGSIYTG